MVIKPTTVGQEGKTAPTVDSRGRNLPKTFSNLLNYLVDFFHPTGQETKDLVLALDSVEAFAEERTQEAVGEAYKEGKTWKVLSEQLQIVVEAQLVEKETLERRSKVDPKTGLSNWDGYKQRAISCVTQEPNASYLVFVVVDLVGFGAVDNTFGLYQGDAVIKVVSRALNKVVRDRRDLGAKVIPTLGYDHASSRSVGELTDMTARYGGDEFLFLLLEAMVNGEQAALRAKKELMAINWFDGAEVQGVDLSHETRQYLTFNRLDLRAGVVHFRLPQKDHRPSAVDAGKIVDSAFNRADALMRQGKKDPENPIHSVVCDWDNGILRDITDVTRAVFS